eukprot:15476189-Alexandrium_andersonii.AAC.1
MSITRARAPAARQRKRRVKLGRSARRRRGRPSAAPRRKHRAPPGPRSDGLRRGRRFEQPHREAPLVARRLRGWFL